MIPKKIHYCWFGGKPLDELGQKCLESWKRFFPDYRIIEWNESNFDINCCDYVREAYEAKKWAFVSDYARFKILYEEGGVYFDTDVEVIRSFDDIITRGNFMGVENKVSAVNPGLGLAVAPGLGLVKEILDAYAQSYFLNDDGTYNLTTIVERTTKIIKSHGLRNINEIQTIADITIYPKEYFCPMDYASGKITLTENTYSIHHYSGSWHSEKEKYAHILEKKVGIFLPKRVSSIFGTYVSIIKYEGLKSSIKWLLKKGY